MMTAFQCLLIALAAAACTTYPKSMRDDKWSYFEEWDTNRNVAMDSTEFVRGYIDQKHFKKWAGRKKELSTGNLVTKLDNGSNDLKRTLATPSDDTLASARQTSRSTEPQSGSMVQFVDRADKNANHRITEREWARAMFNVADENNDGLLTPIEFYLWQLLGG